MFTIRLYELGHKVPNVVVSTIMETLAEAEIIAKSFCVKIYDSKHIEIVYVEDLDYYVYIGETRIARLTINPVYKKVRTKQ